MIVLSKKSPFEEEYGIWMTEDELKKYRNMGELTQGLYEEGFRRGFEEGNERIRADYLKKLMENTGWSLNEAMRVLKIPPNKEAHYRRLIKKH
ncbi:MAG: hypothetical protein UDD25_08075 [Mitsuokella jalaludinii]|uniref:hypothetical protein n=1 Tax=Mitsuokella jalaludinii TaxID=187979 RepID=UPI00298C00D3|nr:hypothetical protein [Mitsuokella jalaludinii]MEE0482181.1 hypothetical protein [Mitsuokella jalaludinii]